MDNRALDIGIVARESGLPASTLRYYEEIGLIRSVGRKGLRRLFDQNVLEHLSFISLGRIAGLSLEEIAGMFTSEGKPSVNRQQLLDKSDELEQTIKRLQAVRDGLRHAAHCPEENHFQCPKFQRLMKVATRNTRKMKSDQKK